MTYSETMLVPYSIWHHVKSDSWYVVLGIAIQSTNGPGEHHVRSVVYQSQTHGHLCYREISEFLDGRFIPMADYLYNQLDTR